MYTDLLVEWAKLDKHAKHIAPFSNECLSSLNAVWYGLTQLIDWGGKGWSLWAELFQGFDNLLGFGTGWFNSHQKFVMLILQLCGLLTAVPKLGVACQEAVTLALQPLQVLYNIMNGKQINSAKGTYTWYIDLCIAGTLGMSWSIKIQGSFTCTVHFSM